MSVISTRTRKSVGTCATADDENNQLRINLSLMLLRVPKPRLTEDQRALPRQLQNFIIYLAKCRSAGFTLVCPAHCVDMFRKSEELVPKIASMNKNKYQGANYSYGSSLNDFHLSWDVQKYQKEFLSGWLTGNSDGYLKRIPIPADSASSSSSYIGTVVAAEWEVDHQYYRALIEAVDKEKQATCYFIDKGNTEKVEFNRLRAIPDDIAKIPPLAFRCELANIDPLNENTFGLTNFRFIKKLKGTFVSCSISKITTNGIAVVKLNETSSATSITLPFNRRVKEDMEYEKKHGINVYVDSHPFSCEENLHYHFTASIRIPMGQIGLEDPTTFRITFVVSPEHFYIQKMTKKERWEVETRDAELQNYYNNNFDPEWYKIKTQRVFVGRPYVSLNEQTKKWERVSVLRVDVPDGYCFVERVDFGEKCLVKVSTMHEIKKEFSLWPKQASQAHLVHIKPREGKQYWDETVKLKFRELVSVLPEEFFGIAVTSTRVINCINEPSYGVILIDNSSRGMTLQARLKDRGLADASGFAAESRHFIFRNGEPSYQGLEEVSMSTTSANRHHDQDYFKGDKEIQPIYKLVGSYFKILNQYISQRCKCTCDPVCVNLFRCPTAYNKRKHRFKKSAKLVRYPCRYIQKDSDSISPDSRSRPCLFMEMFSPFLSCVSISHASGPGIFYVQSPMKSKELLAMIRGLKNVIEMKKENELTLDWEPQENVLVAALVLNDKRSELEWQRAYVTKIIPAVSIAKVILVDVGSQVNVNYRNVQKLPSSFRDISFFCQRAHMDFVDVVPPTHCHGNWSVGHNEDFLKLVGALNKAAGQETIFLAWGCRPKDMETVELDYYNQDVSYDFEQNMWTPHKMSGANLCTFKSSDRNLSHLLKSVGMNLQFPEKRCTTNQSTQGCFNFSSITQFFM